MGRSPNSSQAGPQSFKREPITDSCCVCVACGAAVAAVGGFFLLKPVHDVVVQAAATPIVSVLPAWSLEKVAVGLEQVAIPLQKIWDDVVTSALRVWDVSSAAVIGSETRHKPGGISGCTFTDRKDQFHS